MNRFLVGIPIAMMLASGSAAQARQAVIDFTGGAMSNEDWAKVAAGQHVTWLRSGDRTCQLSTCMPAPGSPSGRVMWK